MPQALIDEIQKGLDSGIDPKQIARDLGRRAGLDYGEMRSIWEMATTLRDAEPTTS